MPKQNSPTHTRTKASPGSSRPPGTRKIRNDNEQDTAHHHDRQRKRHQSDHGDHQARPFPATHRARDRNEPRKHDGDPVTDEPQQRTSARAREEEEKRPLRRSSSHRQSEKLRRRAIVVVVVVVVGERAREKILGEGDSEVSKGVCTQPTTATTTTTTMNEQDAFPSFSVLFTLSFQKKQNHLKIHMEFHSNFINKIGEVTWRSNASPRCQTGQSEADIGRHPTPPPRLCAYGSSDFSN
ncbi:hypothetical protein NL676_017243 [Syzygium grande]|nr:hypothetical protein NL676_017243 [Syzygium grande]